MSSQAHAATKWLGANPGCLTSKTVSFTSVQHILSCFKWSAKDRETKSLAQEHTAFFFFLLIISVSQVLERGNSLGLRQRALRLAFEPAQHLFFPFPSSPRSRSGRIKCALWAP